MTDTSSFQIFPDSVRSVHVMDFYGKNQYTPLHFHDNFEILYVVEGTLAFTLGGVAQTASRGECILIHRGELHEIPPTAAHYICILYPATLFDFFRDEGELRLASRIRDARADAYVHEILKLSFAEASVDRSLAVFGATYTFFAYLLRHYPAAPGDSGELPAPCLAALRYLQTHYTEEIPLEVLCRIAGVGEQTLERQFRRCTGTTVRQYLLSLRLNRGYDLLLHTEQSVTEIAFACGFRDSNYFTRLFRRCNGKTPREIRAAGENVASAVRHHVKNR